ncbi:DNA-3-methyladenine glycosylase I [Pacificispira sp.]|uniref:DNA-3-methyladenine glycosylase I n=1 Tax=Pacificispira sp. TaxID=2888761 RepID=UPI003BAD7D02
MGWYCDYAIGDALHGPYHDTEYGFPEEDEARLFERLTMEIMQAGLNWGLVLRKRASLNAAFDGFDVDRVASYGDDDVARLMADEGIVRNRLKVHAVIHNARVLQGIRESHGGFASWIAAHHPLTKLEWIKLFKKTFKFTGGEITGEFLMSIGYLPGTHRDDCPVQVQLMEQGTPWMTIGRDFYEA